MGMILPADISDVDIGLTYSNELSSQPKICHQLQEHELQMTTYGAYSASGGGTEVLSRFPRSGSMYIGDIVNDNKLQKTINKIKNTFFLNTTDFSDIMGVNRRTVYNWLEGSSDPHPKNMKKLFELLLISQAWDLSGLKIVKKQLFEPVSGKLNLLQLLSEEEPSIDDIIFAGTSLALQNSAESISDPFS